MASELSGDFDDTGLYRDIFEASREPIFVHDIETGEILRVNDAAAELLGTDRESLVGQSIPNLAPDGEEYGRERAADILSEVREEGQTSVEWQVEREDGERRYVEVSCQAARLDDEEYMLAFVKDVTAYRDVETRLAAERDKFAHLLDISPVGIVVHDSDGTITKVNDLAEEILGIPAERLLGEGVRPDSIDFETVDGGSLPDREFPFEQVDRSGSPVFDRELVVCQPDGDRTVISANAAPLVDRTDSLDWVVVTFEDVTDRKKRTRQLETQRRLREAVFNSPQTLVGLLEPDGTLVEANETALDVVSESADDVVGEPFSETPWWTGNERKQAQLRDAIAAARDGEQSQFTAQHGVPDGETIVVQVTVRPILRDGDVVNIIVEAIDITEQRDREAELRNRNEELQAFLDNLPVVLFTFDDDGEFTRSVGKGLETIGLESGELVGTSVFEVYADNPDIIEDVERALDGKEHRSIVELGDVVFETWYRPVTDGNGDVTEVIGLSRDVTEMKHREQSLEELSKATNDLFSVRSQREAASAIVDVADQISDFPLVALWIYDDEHHCLVPAGATEAATDVAGADTVEGLTVMEEGSLEMDLFESGSPELIENYTARRAVSNPDTPLGSVYALPLGEHGLLHVGSSNVTSLSETDTYLLEILRESATATLEKVERDQELSEYREELEHSNENLQQFAYVASHDLQEPLRMVSSYVDLLESEYGDQLDGEAEEYMEFAVDGARRMQDMIDALLRYARVQTRGEEFESCDPETVLEETVNSLRMHIEETDASVTHESLPTVLADGNQLGQVFQNLIENAITYADEDGVDPRVTVTAEDVDAGHDSMIRFAVSDNGPGIPPDQQDAMFEIFKRGNSDAGDGTGIGLAVTQRIVRRHGGDLWVESDGENGSTFYFTMPAPDTESIADD